MSHIHEALNKAQKEKDARYREYHGIVSAAGSKPRPFSGKTPWLIFFLLISLAFTAYLLLPFRGTRPPMHELATHEATRQPESSVNTVALYERAGLLHKNGRLHEAKQLYEEILNLDPDYVDALNNLGVIHIHNKNYSTARSNFEKAIVFKPDYVDPYYNLACLHAIKGEVPQGLARLKKAVSLDRSVKDWARKDTDLKNLRGSPGFEDIVQTKVYEPQS